MRLSITTPRGALVDTEVEEVTAAGELGEFGVLPGHVPLMSALKPGVLWYKAKDHQGILALGQGFLQVAPLPQADDHHGGLARDRVLVLVDQALMARDVDTARAEKDLAAADQGLVGAVELAVPRGQQTLVERRGWAQARLDAAARVASH